MKIEVLEKDEKIRLDKYLFLKTGTSRSFIKSRIDDNKVLVNGKIAKASLILKANDIIEADLNKELDLSVEPKKMNLDIIYEDNDVIVINKESGVVVHPACGNYDNTLVNGLLFHTNALSNENGLQRPGIVHRIDKDTSGLLVIAKNNKAHRLLSDQLKDKTLNREYIALVYGRFNHKTGTVDAPIGRSLNDRKKMAVTNINSKDAVTHFTVLERYKNTSLLSLTLTTGRTHQIRVHMNYINHPIVNDPVYSNKCFDKDFGQMLHARKISFIHPTTKEKMTFECDMPNKFYEILEKYKNE